MLNKVRKSIMNKLLADDVFINKEDDLVSILSGENSNVDDELINLLTELIEIVIEKAYLEGYKDGTAEQVEKQVKGSVLEWLEMEQLDEILDWLKVVG